MLFNSIDFAVFFPIVFILYWLFNKHLRVQNIIILLSSYIFYGWWDYRFLLLIVISSMSDYLIGNYLAKSKKNRKLLLMTSLFINLGMLAFFKYYNFFIESFVSSFKFLGSEISMPTLNIILPVGISFYTFQTLSYTIDIYRNKIKPSHDIIQFFSYVAFFPQLVAGPIERAAHLLPQFSQKKIFNPHIAVDGCRQILFGFFKKVVVADTCGEVVNIIFDNYQDQSGLYLIAGAFLFAFQIYGDFSGYSDIAIGLSKLLGFDLCVNFKYPYFSRDIAEFWRRWHISLSTWFRDYLYIPLGGSKVRLNKQIRNIFIVFLVSGFWHGANWTFIFWGGLHAVFYLPLLLRKKNREHLDVVSYQKKFLNFKDFLKIVCTFFLCTCAWVFFRSESLSDAFLYFKNIGGHPFFALPKFNMLNAFFWITLLIVIDWNGRHFEHPLQLLGRKTILVRWLSYLFLGMAVILSAQYHNSQTFIYFQF